MQIHHALAFCTRIQRRSERSLLLVLHRLQREIVLGWVSDRCPVDKYKKQQIWRPEGEVENNGAACCCRD
jgi:hypothetical protein